MNPVYLPAILLLFFSVVAVTIAKLAPDDTMPQLAVVYPPDKSFEENYTAAISAGVRVVRNGNFSNVLIVSREDVQNVSERLYKSGALLIFNPVIEGACVLTPRREISAYNI